MTGSTHSVHVLHLHTQPCQHVATDVTTNDIVIIDIGISIIMRLYTCTLCTNVAYLGGATCLLCHTTCACMKQVNHMERHADASK